MKSKILHGFGILLLGGGAAWAITQISKAFDAEPWLNPTGWFADCHWYFGPASVGTIGQMKNGSFVETDETLPVWMANSPACLVDGDPSFHLYAQVTKPTSAFPAGPPGFLQVRLQSFYADGSAVSPGVSTRFALVSSDQRGHTYQSNPFVLVDNINAEGEWPNVIGITADDNCWPVVLWD